MRVYAVAFALTILVFCAALGVAEVAGAVTVTLGEVCR